MRKNQVAFEIKLNDLRPRDITIAKLADYLAAVSAIIGTNANVEFKQVIRGSAGLQSFCLKKDIEPIRDRLVNAKGKSKFKRFESLLESDETGAQISIDKQTVVAFSRPVKKVKKDPILLPQELISIRGELIKLGGTDATVPFEIVEQASQMRVKGNTRNRTLAKEMAKHLFDTVEVGGIGTWLGDPDSGEWELKDFKANRVTALNSTPVLETFNNIRKDTDRNGKAHEILRDLREDNH